ncbi:hypothetical protein NDI56_20990 [Haloarcula sp. S1CR25-12]|uniref:Uncharacterized protein n=1 Tax=Haloarcula saliterrae TaxID=2950534 RepID=A0ABU2FHY9_9EURY|nr:hypothetical protein [Haloarcula sp. S1CR25-12]MDS0261885.1 hypothetical protein [Haloarcula sp. S1CR25-12]
MKLSTVVVTGGMEEILLFTIKQMAHKIFELIDEEYSVTETAAKWSEKVVSGLKSSLNLQTLLPSSNY